MAFRRGSDSRFAGRVPLRYLLLAIFAVVIAGLTVVLAPLAAAAPTAQESPYLQPPDSAGGSGTSSLFQPLEGLPIWAQAALFSAAVVVILYILFEGAGMLWERIKHVIYTRERPRS